MIEGTGVVIDGFGNVELMKSEITADITSSVEGNLNDLVDEKIINKVDKVTGKGLSTNDYTTTDKNKVGQIDNKVDKISGKGLSTNDYTSTDKNKVGQIDNKANINSPTFTGVPCVPTVSSNNNSNQIASTAFVQNVLHPLNQNIKAIIYTNALPSTPDSNTLYLLPKE